MSKEKLVKKTQQMTEDLDNLTVDEINEKAPKADYVPQEESLKTRAEMEGAIYVEPNRKLKGFGDLKPEWKKEHAHDWEYVKGVLENRVITGEPLRFWYTKWPCDPDCEWIIPCNRPVYVPRMVAKHLEEKMAYHQFGYLEKPKQQQSVDDFVEQFSVIGTDYRAKFNAVGSFA